MNVVIATDGTPSATAAVAWSTQFLALDDVTLYVVSAVPSMTPYVSMTPGTYVPEGIIDDLREAGFMNARKALDEARGLLGVRGAQATYLAREGEPTAVILDLARGVEADLVVVGSGGKGPVARLMEGSVSDALLHHLPGTVLVVRRPAHQAA